MPDFQGLLAKTRGPMAEPEVEPVEDPADPDADLTERVSPIAQDLLEAVRGGDVAGIASALIAANRAVSSGPSEGELEE